MKNVFRFLYIMLCVWWLSYRFVDDGDFVVKFNLNRMFNVGLKIVILFVYIRENYKGSSFDKKWFLCVICLILFFSCMKLWCW